MVDEVGQHLVEAQLQAVDLLFRNPPRTPRRPAASWRLYETPADRDRSPGRERRARGRWASRMRDSEGVQGCVLIKKHRDDLPDAPASRVRRTRGLSPTSRTTLPPLRSSALTLWMMQRSPTDARNETSVRSTSTAIGRVAANAVKGNSISPTPIMSSRPPSDPEQIFAQILMLHKNCGSSS